MTKELADSIKRLRELGAKRTPGKFTIKVKEIWDEKALTSFHSTIDRAVEYGQAIQTINQLVELVAEMREAMQTCKYSKVTWQNGKNETFWFDFYKIEKTSTKADALLTGLKEGV
jgi:hypothetical protein